MKLNKKRKSINKTTFFFLIFVSYIIYLTRGVVLFYILEHFESESLTIDKNQR